MNYNRHIILLLLSVCGLGGLVRAEKENKAVKYLTVCCKYQNHKISRQNNGKFFCRIPCHFEAVPLEELDTRLRGERRPQPFSRSVKYISGCIRRYAVSVDLNISQEMVIIFLGGYADTRIRGEINPSFSEEMGSILWSGTSPGKNKHDSFMDTSVGWSVSSYSVGVINSLKN